MWRSSTRQLLGDAERHAGGQDRDLVHRVGVLEHVRAHRVAALVVGDDAPSPRRVSAIDSRRRPISTRSRASSKSSLVHLVARRGAPRTARPRSRGWRGRRRSCRACRGRRRRRRRRATIFLSRKCTLRISTRSSCVGQRHQDLAVEAARAQQRGVEDVGAVGGRHHHDALGGLEAVHLGEHLVERLLALVVPAAEARRRACGRSSRSRRRR